MVVARARSGAGVGVMLSGYFCLRKAPEFPLESLIFETRKPTMPCDHPARQALAPRIRIWALAAFAALALATVGVPAMASLGGGLESINADRVHMKAQQAPRVTATPAYTMHEDALPSGISVRQYVSGNGVVFAVTWSGPFKPDLRQLLGPYFDVMLAHQAKSIHAGHPRTRVREHNLVIESGGHMRNFYGRAFLPNQFPAGISTDDIQ